MSAFGGVPPTTPFNPNNGFIVPHPPDDTVSRLRFSPAASGEQYLIAGSWNGSVRCWKVDPSAGINALAMTEHPAPILDCSWSVDGRSVFCAGADKIVNCWDLESNSKKVVAMHDAAVRFCFDVAEVNFLATGSWDKTIKYWDVRTPTGQPSGVVNLSERVYAMDVRGPLMVVGLAERSIVVYDVRKPSQPFQSKFSQLKYQTRTIATFPDSMGYAVGSIEGKVSIDHVQEQSRNNDFVFRCHRGVDDKPYTVNVVRFDNNSGTLATAGSDGLIQFWDKDRKKPADVEKFLKMDAPICDVDFSANGSLYAYATGYDWSQGAAGCNPAKCIPAIILKNFVVGDSRANGSREGRGGRGRGRGRGRGQRYNNRGR